MLYFSNIQEQTILCHSMYPVRLVPLITVFSYLHYYLQQKLTFSCLPSHHVSKVVPYSITSTEHGTGPGFLSVINLVICCHYFLPCSLLLSKSEITPFPWLLPNYTAWWQYNTTEYHTTSHYLLPQFWLFLCLLSYQSTVMYSYTTNSKAVSLRHVNRNMHKKIYSQL